MPSSHQRDLGRYLREQREQARLSLRQLAESVEVTRAADARTAALGQLEGLRKPGADLLQGLARGLRVSADSLYERAGAWDERDGDELAMQTAVLADPALTERQKRALLDIYASFRAENARSQQPARRQGGEDEASAPQSPG